MSEHEPTAENEAPLCVGCNVREPWEHRCDGVPCPCAECREADRLFPSTARVTPPGSGDTEAAL